MRHTDWLYRTGLALAQYFTGPKFRPTGADEKAFVLVLGILATLVVGGVLGMGMVALFGLDIDTQDRLLNLAFVWVIGSFPMQLHYRLGMGGRTSSTRIKWLAIAWPVTLIPLTLSGKLKRQ